MNVTRRQALIHLATLMGASLAGPRLLSAALTPGAAAGFAPGEIALLDEIGDTIIPATDVPGAKAVHIGAFIAMMVNDCYDAPDQAAVKAGLKTLADTYRARHGTEFAQGDAATRTAFLNTLDQEQRAYTAARRPDQPQHYFRILKDLTILGYFTSETGATQALRYEEVPGRYDGNVPYKKGDRAFFN